VLNSGKTDHFVKSVGLLILFILLFIFLFSCSAHAARVKGKIFSISRKAGAIEIYDLTYGRIKVFLFSDRTKFINARSIRDFAVDERVEIRYRGKNNIQSMKKMLVWVPEDKVIRTRQLAKLIKHESETYLLIDARNWYEYQKGHLPTAIWIPVERFSNYIHLLPIEKKKLIVFYSDGITDDKAIKVARLTELSGYLNVKVYIFGVSAWKNDKQLVVVDNSWLIRNLDPNKVIIDVRDRVLSLKSHIQNAVSIESKSILQIGDRSTVGKKRRKTEPQTKRKLLPALPDKTAQIVLYGVDTDSSDVLTAYKELVGWEYDSVAVLNGGFNEWGKKYPVIQGAARIQIRYKKYKPEGTVSPKKFVKLLNAKQSIFLDVRTVDEATRGKLTSALHIPLSELETRFKELKKTDPIVIYCANGIRSQIAYSILKSEGFKNAKFLNSTIIIDRSGKYEIRLR